jgi:hypothetical protein
LWTWRGRRYLLRGVLADDYRAQMRSRSRRWDTVFLPHQVFCRLVRPLQHFTRGAVAAATDCPF